VAVGLRPTRLIPLVLVGYLANLLLGPFYYEYYSTYAVGYVALCFGSLMVGSLVAESVGVPVSAITLARSPRYQLSSNHERLLQIAMFLAVISSLLTAYYLLVVSGVSYEGGLGEVRRTLTQRHFTQADIADPFWSKVAEAVSMGGAVFYLMVAALERTRDRLTVPLAFLCLLGPAAGALLAGGRGGAISAAVFLVTAGLVRRRKGLPFLLPIGGFPVAVGVLGLIAYYTLQIFVLRAEAAGADGIDFSELLLVIPGDLTLRASYQRANDALGGSLGPLYMLSYYFSHSLSFFSRVFDAMDYEQIFYGGLLFRVVGFVLRPLQIPFPAYLEITYSQAFFGRYPTFVQGFLLDWGLMGTPLVAVLSGLLWGRAWRGYVVGGFWAWVVYPAVVTMIIASPIYYFPHWGGMDFVLAATLVMWVFVRNGVCEVAPNMGGGTVDA
jgi:hypothetical protein